MLPSTHNANCPDTVSLPFLSGLTTNSKQDQHLILPFTLLDFPSSSFPLCPEEDSALLLQPSTGYSLPSAKTSAMEPGEQFFNINDFINNTSKHEQGTVVPSKRCLNKDRHSKINTAQGPRDRRMRLSLEVARKFFDLQDTLGFDKASMTVEWLLTQSEPAIEELSKDFGNSYKLTGEMAWESSPSDCDVVSGIIDESVDAFIDGDQPEKAGDDSKEFQPQPDLGKARKMSRSQASTRRFSSSHLARESREKARARAKERTREKMMSRMLQFNNGSKPFEIGGEWWAGHLGHNMKLPNMGVQAEVEEPEQLQAIREHRIVDPFTITSNYLQGIGIFQENQFRDFQLYPKPWEACNGTSHLC